MRRRKFIKHAVLMLLSREHLPLWICAERQRGNSAGKRSDIGQ